MTKKYKEIACAFSRYDKNVLHKSTEDCYFDWLLTEEGKRLTAEERICGQTCGCSVPEQCPNIIAKEGLAADAQSSYDLLVKISGQLDRIEGNMKVVISNDPIKIKIMREP